MKCIRVLSAVSVNVRINRFSSCRAGLLKKSSKPKKLRKSREYGTYAADGISASWLTERSLTAALEEYGDI